MEGTGPGGAGGLGAVVRFAVTAALVGAVLLVWSVALPRFAAPDEDQHVRKAYALMHGDAGVVDPATGERTFAVPGDLSSDPMCFALTASNPADCQQDQVGAGEQVDLVSRASNYPPLYYLLVGWPALISSGGAMVHAMRVVNAAWVALFVALAVRNAAALRRPAPMLVAFVVVLSPVLFFLGSTVGPSGVSIAAGLAVWTGGFLLLRGPAAARLLGPVSVVAAPLCLLILIRRDSVLWAGLIVGGLLALAQADVLSELVRSKVVWMWSAIVVACVGFQLVVSGAETGASVAAGTGSTRLAIGELPYYLRQMVGGVLGWLDTELPAGVYVVLFGVLGFVVIAAVAFASRRFAIVVGVLIAVTLAMPVAIGSRTFPYFQGRYLLPFAVGVPLVAALGLSESRVSALWPRRLAWILVPVAVVANVAAFAQVLHRFSAAADGPWWFDATPPWQPAFGSLSAYVVAAAVTVAAALAWTALLLRDPEPDPVIVLDGTPTDDLPGSFDREQDEPRGSDLTFG